MTTFLPKNFAIMR